ncbi:MAG: Ku protein [Proteobacteria bacterium]|nr:Ku protein [Pseudomonadota bacterium]
MVARAIASTTISFGLVSIPIKLYSATASQAVRFNWLDQKTGARVKQRYYCPVDNRVVERSEMVRGYEFAKGQYVQFTEQELKSLEAERSNTLDIVEFVPLESVDPIQVEKSYYLGPDKGGHKAFTLLAKTMREADKVAVGRLWSRGKTQLVLLRPYKKGLLLHQVHYASEVRSYDDVDLGDDVVFAEVEVDLAGKLIEQLATPAFQPGKYHDEYSDRVRKAAEEKVAGQEITSLPEQPQAQIIDLFDALKKSLEELETADPAQEDAADSREHASGELKGPKKASVTKKAQAGKRAAK